jgi:uncharacterized protein (DUF1684 family)
MADDNYLALAHWRRTSSEMYALLRQTKDPVKAWQRFVAFRNHLFKSHAQSPLTAEQQAAFQGLSYYPYDPAFRVIGYLDYAVDQLEFALELAEDGLLRFKRIATIHFELLGQSTQLSLFWVQGYGGGLFLPFRDLTSQTESFGGGRYLYDTIKGADLGATDHEILLDFNFAYNPSCAYNDRWVCPLPPRENDIDIAIAAGEKRFVVGNGALELKP